MLPGLSEEDSSKENLCLKKRHQLLEQILPLEKLKFCNLKLYNHGVKVTFEDLNPRRPGFPNVLQIIARNLVNFGRRMKFANARTLSDCNVVCICETRLNANKVSWNATIYIYLIPLRQETTKMHEHPQWCCGSNKEEHQLWTAKKR